MVTNPAAPASSLADLAVECVFFCFGGFGPWTTGRPLDFGRIYLLWVFGPASFFAVGGSSRLFGSFGHSGSAYFKINFICEKSTRFRQAYLDVVPGEFVHIALQWMGLPWTDPTLNRKSTFTVERPDARFVGQRHERLRADRGVGFQVLVAF